MLLPTMEIGEGALIPLTVSTEETYCVPSSAFVCDVKENVSGTVSVGAPNAK